MSYTRIGVVIGTLGCAVILAACVSQGGSQPSAGGSALPVGPAASASAINGTPVPAGSPGTAVARTGSPVASGTAVNATTSPSPFGSATPGLTIAATVTPSDVAVGNVTVTMALEPARHMFEQGSVPTPDPAQPTPAPNQSRNVGSAVFSGMVQVTNNVDPTQSLAPDSAQSIVRHVVVEVTPKGATEPVPYLNVTMDLLLDGHPVLYDQGLVPMAPVEQSTPQLYYGNNVRFPQKGTYQVFVRIKPSPLVGKTPPPAAQFNLVLS